MRVLALDTSTRRGSLALLGPDGLIGLLEGNAAIPHGGRLPGEALRLLETHGVTLTEIDLFAACAGPGSFTGLRVGLATIQGLAMVRARPAVGISAFDAVAHQVLTDGASRPGPGDLLGVWIDAQRDEIFSALFLLGGRPGPPPGVPAGEGLEGLFVQESPMVGPPAGLLDRWTSLAGATPVWLAGNGVRRHADLLSGHGVRAAWTVADVPDALAPAVGALALRRAVQEGGRPHRLHPLYVRRPDAQLARERRGLHVDR